LFLGVFFGVFFGGLFALGLHGWQVGGGGIGQTGSGGGVLLNQDLISVIIRRIWR